VITSLSANRLDRVSAYVVNSNRFDKVVFSGHTDDNASLAYNLKLSERRAVATADYMEGQGVDSEMFEIHAFGESLPALLNDSDESRAYNRRVHVELKR
jgi:OOP family OmpA-OmpF porin